jgi:hypothetical protein
MQEREGVEDVGRVFFLGGGGRVQHLEILIALGGLHLGPCKADRASVSRFSSYCAVNTHLGY